MGGWDKERRGREEPKVLDVLCPFYNLPLIQPHKVNLHPHCPSAPTASEKESSLSKTNPTTCPHHSPTCLPVIQKPVFKCSPSLFFIFLTLQTHLSTPFWTWGWTAWHSLLSLNWFLLRLVLHFSLVKQCTVASCHPLPQIPSSIRLVHILPWNLLPLQSQMALCPPPIWSSTMSTISLFLKYLPKYRPSISLEALHLLLLNYNSNYNGHQGSVIGPLFFSLFPLLSNVLSPRASITSYKLLSVSLCNSNHLSSQLYQDLHLQLLPSYLHIEALQR